MKTKTTIKHIRQNYKKVYQCGYCDLQDIFVGREPRYYNAGVYGWNCDIYCDILRDIAITTGYRAMTGRMIPAELIEKYSNIAKEIRKSTKNYNEIRDELDKNIDNFYDELDNL